MDIVELRQKSVEELRALLKDTEAGLRRLRFLVGGGQLKTVREIRDLRQRIARIKTLLNK